MNVIKVWMWCERSRFSISDRSVVDCDVVKIQASEIKFIYSFLHVFRMADMISLIGLCSKDIDVR